MVCACRSQAFEHRVGLGIGLGTRFRYRFRYRVRLIYCKATTYASIPDNSALSSPTSRIRRCRKRRQLPFGPFKMQEIGCRDFVSAHFARDAATGARFRYRVRLIYCKATTYASIPDNSALSSPTSRIRRCRKRRQLPFGPFKMQEIGCRDFVSAHFARDAATGAPRSAGLSPLRARGSRDLTRANAKPPPPNYGGWPRARAGGPVDHTATGVPTTGISPRSTTPDSRTTIRRVGGDGGRGGASGPVKARAGG